MGTSYDLTPNAYGQPTEISGADGKNVITRIWHHPNGSYSRIDSGSSSLRSGRDHLYQIRNRQHYKDDTRDTFYTYSYDSEANMSYLKNQITGKNQRMYYDNGNRLTKVSGSRLGTRTFTYNSRDDITGKVDNGVSYTYNYDWRGRLSDIASKHPKREFSYNQQGEVTALHTYRNNGPESLRQLNMTRDAEGRLERTSEGTKYGYDSRGLRFFKEKNGRIYSYYDLGGKLRYRLDRGAGVSTEYHYVGNELIAKREIFLAGGTPPSSGGGGTSSNVETQGNYQVNHSTRTVTWTLTGWHQVQTSLGEDIGCNGGKSCTVPGPGSYQAIDHSTNKKSPITVKAVSSGGGTTTEPPPSSGGGSTSSNVETQGNYQVNHSTRTVT